MHLPFEDGCDLDKQIGMVAVGFKPTSASFNNHGDDWESGMNQEKLTYIHIIYIYIVCIFCI